MYNILLLAKKVDKTVESLSISDTVKYAKSDRKQVNALNPKHCEMPFMACKA